MARVHEFVCHIGPMGFVPAKSGWGQQLPPNQTIKQGEKKADTKKSLAFLWSFMCDDASESKHLFLFRKQCLMILLCTIYFASVNMQICPGWHSSFKNSFSSCLTFHPYISLSQQWMLIGWKLSKWHLLGCANPIAFSRNASNTVAAQELHLEVTGARLFPSGTFTHSLELQRFQFPPYASSTRRAHSASSFCPQATASLMWL